jgi:hypothetical protein
MITAIQENTALLILAPVLPWKETIKYSFLSLKRHLHSILHLNHGKEESDILVLKQKSRKWKTITQLNVKRR